MARLWGSSGLGCRRRAPLGQLPVDLPVAALRYPDGTVVLLDRYHRACLRLGTDGKVYALDPDVPHIGGRKVEFLPDKPRPSRRVELRLLAIFRRLRWGDDLDEILADDRDQEEWRRRHEAGLVFGRWQRR